jgi:hypothetical protein
VPCYRWGALNEPPAPRCRQCSAWWPGKTVARSSSAGEAPENAGTAAHTAETRTQPITRASVTTHRVYRGTRFFQFSGWGLAVVGGTVVLAVVVAAGYYAQRARQADVSRLGAVSGTAKGSGGPAAIGALVNPSDSASGGAPGASSPSPAPPAAADAKPIAPAAEVSPAAARSGATPPDEAHPAATPAVARSSGETLTRPRRPAPEARAETVPVPAGPRPSTAGVAPGVIEHQPPRVGPCTEAVAALGLCAPESVQRRE